MNHERRGGRELPAEVAIRERTQRAIAELARANDGELRRRHLPITEKHAAITYAIQMHDAVSIEAPPGAGKSIDVAVLVRNALGRGAIVGMTQPRRDAAENVCIATAARHELEFGPEICYSTSEFHGNRPETEIQIQTSGILLNQLQKDPLLERYDAVIVDEAHERSLDIDLTVGLLKRANELRRKQGRKPIKIIVASATMEQKKLQGFFGIPDVAVIQSRGKMHEVTVGHIEPRKKYEVDKATGRERARPYPTLAAEQALDIIRQGQGGDILIFMPGKNEILATRDTLNDLLARSRLGDTVETMTLHGENSHAERAYVLQGKRAGDRRRRVIISTNIAETSLTVPGITHVIDSCRKKEVRFDPKTGLEVLTEVEASKAECIQRAGRAGRLAKGTVHRLVTDAEFADLPDHPEAEIKRLNLAHMALRLIGMGIRDLETFPFVDPPPAEHLAVAIQTLHDLGAITEDRALTRVGKRMAELPLEPRLGRVVAAAEALGCVNEAVGIAQLIEEGNALRRVSREDESIARSQLIERGSREKKRWAYLETIPGYGASAEARLTAAEAVILRLVAMGETDLSQTRLGYRLQEHEVAQALAELRNKGFLDETNAPTASGRAEARKPLAAPNGQPIQERYSMEELGIREENVRRTAQETLRERQAPLREGLTSDWLLYHRIFTLFRKEPNGTRERFCAEHGLDFAVLQRAERGYYRVLKDLRGIVQSGPSDATGEHLTHAILAGYAPDHLIRSTGSRRGYEYERLDNGDRQVRINGSSLAQDKLPPIGVCLDLQEGWGTMAGKRGAAEKVKFRYAIGVHPIDAGDLLLAIPQLTRREGQPRFSLTERGEIRTTVGVSFRAKDGRWLHLGDGTIRERSPEATRALGEELASGTHALAQDPRLHGNANRAIAEELDRLRARAKGRIPWKGLGAWYESRLGDAISLEEALALDTDYRLRLEDICDDETRAAIHQEAPDRIDLDGRPCPIEYASAAGSPNAWRETDRHAHQEVTSELGGETLEKTYLRLARLSPEDAEADVRRAIRCLGQDDTLAWRVKVPTWTEYATKNLGDLQRLVEDAYLKHAFEALRPQSLPSQAGQVPHLADLGLGPVAYAKKPNGESVYAYPSVHLHNEWDYRANGLRAVFQLRYHPSAEAAAADQEKTDAHERMVIAKEQRAKDRETVQENGETLLETAIVQLTRVRTRIAGLIEGYDAERVQAAYAAWLAPEDAKRIEAAYREAFRALHKPSYQERLNGDWQEDADPRAALDALGGIEAFLDERAEARRRDLVQMESLQPRIEALRETMETSFGSGSRAYAEFGLTRAQEDAFRTLWQDIRYAAQTRLPAGTWQLAPLPDPERVERLITDLERRLADLRQPKDLELRRELADILEGRDRHYARLIVVKNGRVAKAFAPTEAHSPAEQQSPSEIPIGKSGRTLLVHGNRVVTSWGGDGAIGYSLPDGIFVFPRDAHKAIEVRPAEDGIHWEPIRTIEGDYAERLFPSSSRRNGDGTASAAAKPSVTTSASFADLLNRKAKATPAQAPIAPQPRVTDQIEHRAETMTDFLRNGFLQDLHGATAVLKELLTRPEWVPKPAQGKSPTSLEKQQERLRGQIMQRLGSVKAALDEARTSDNVERLRGIVGEATRLKPILTEAATLLRTSPEAPTRYRELLRLIPTVEAEWDATLSEAGLERLRPKLARLALGEGQDDTALYTQAKDIIAEEIVG